MDKPKLAFDYSRFDNIDDSDDEDTHYPGFDRNLNIRVNRLDRERRDEELDEKKKELLAEGKVAEAEALERKRPIHVHNACHVTDEKTIIHSSGTPSWQRDEFKADEYCKFKTEHEKVLQEFAEADWEKSQAMLRKHGDILLDGFANSYYSLTALDEGVLGKRERMRQLCYQGEIVNQIQQIAAPAKRHPRDMVASFFDRFNEDGNARAAFEQGFETFVLKLEKRAADKKRESEEALQKSKEEAQAPRKKEKLVKAMYTMSKEERLGPGGLDPVEVFESLPQEMQTAFRDGDIELLQQIAEEMPDEEFDGHLQRCIDSGLWQE